MPLLPQPQAALRTSSSLLRRRTISTLPSSARLRPSTSCSPIHSNSSTPSSPSSSTISSAPTAQIRAASTQSTHGAADQTQHGSSEHTGDHGHSHDAYEPPTGWLWGIPPGEQYQKEGWENVWYWGFYGSLGVAAVAYAWKPDTK